MSSAAKSQNPPSLVQEPKLIEYHRSMSLRTTPVQKELMEVIEKHPRAVMSSPPDEAATLAWFLQLIKAKKVIEVGVVNVQDEGQITPEDSVENDISTTEGTPSVPETSTVTLTPTPTGESTSTP